MQEKQFQALCAQAARGIPFYRSKLVNIPLERDVAPELIRRFYQQQRLRMIDVSWNEAPDNSVAQQGWDIQATVEVVWTNLRIDRWELKTDKLWHRTGNFFLEHEALDHSKADYFLILAGFAFVLTREAVLELKNGPYKVVRGGDDNKVQGSLVPLSEMQLIATIV